MSGIAFKAPAGLGKTEEYVEAVAFSTQPLIEIYVPTLELAEEVKSRIERANPNKRVTAIRGRSAIDSAGTPMCKRNIIAEGLAKTGQSVFPSLCLRKQPNSAEPIKCEFFDGCRYIQQFRGGEVRIYAHAYLPLERNMLEGTLPNVVIIDESFWKVCIDADVPFDITLLADPDIPDPAKLLCQDILANILTDPASVKARVRNAVVSGEYAAAVRGLRRIQADINPSMNDREITARLAKSGRLVPIIQLFKLLLVESKFQRPMQAITFDSDRRTLKLHIKNTISRFREKGLRAALPCRRPVFIFDANASPLIISQFIEIKRFEDIYVKRNSHVTQCYSTRASTISLVPEKNITKESMAGAQRKLDRIQAWLDSLAGTSAKVLVVGPSAVVGNRRKDQEPLLRCPANGDFAHYNALRGIDRWNNFDIVVIIGRNQPSTEAVENIARALFSNDEEPLVLTGEWIEEPRAYLYDDGSACAKGVMVQAHTDPRVNTVLHQLRECESEQAIDRLRLIHCKEPKKVFLVSDIPLDIDVRELRSFDEIMSGGNRLEIAWDRLGTGVLPLSGQWLSSNYSDLWPTEESARKGVGRDMNGMEAGQSSNGFSIRGLSGFTYEYRQPGQRNWSKCLSAHPSVEATYKALKTILGDGVLVRQRLPGKPP